MKLEKYTVVAPVLHRGFIVESGEIDLDSDQAERLIDMGVVKEIETLQDDSDTELQMLRERAKELGVPNAGRLGEAKLKEGIAEKEAELKELQEKAFELGIEDAYEKDAATLAKEIEAAEQK